MALCFEHSATKGMRNLDTNIRNSEKTAYLLIPDGVSHVEGIVLQGILGIYPFLVSLVFALVLLSLLDHSLNLILAQAALVIGDGDLVLSACTAKYGQSVHIYRHMLKDKQNKHEL